MRPRAIAMLIALAAASPAAARPPEALACALQTAPQGLDARVADVIVNRDTAAGRAVLDDLRAVTDRCAADQFLTPKQRDAYFNYVLGRMGRDVIDGRLAAVGVSSALIDSALDIGPGNANNPADKVTQGDLRMVGDALAHAGKDPKAITPAAWALIAAWIVATANMFDGLRDLD
jgi:hypothetical protein